MVYKITIIYGCFSVVEGIKIFITHVLSEVFGKEQGLHPPWSEMTEVKQGEGGFGFYYSWDPRAVSILVHGQGLCWFELLC